MEDSRSKRIISTFHIAGLRVVGEDTDHGESAMAEQSFQTMPGLFDGIFIAYMLLHSFSRMA